MSLCMILAMDNNMLVGSSNSHNGIPWDYPEDMAFYKKMTINKKNIMGRITYDQIGRPLPNRETFVMTRDKNLAIDGVTVVHSVEEVLALNTSDEEIMITGGVDIFRLFFDKIDIIYLTKVDIESTGNTYYKEFSTDGFKLVDEYTGENPELLFQKWVRC